MIQASISLPMLTPRSPSHTIAQQAFTSWSGRIEGTCMTGDQSRVLKIYDRVCWKNSATDLGTVIGTAWSGVTISWDDGDTTSIQHNDMAQVERVPTKVM